MTIHQYSISTNTPKGGGGRTNVHAPYYNCHFSYTECVPGGGGGGKIILGTY